MAPDQGHFREEAPPDPGQLGKVARLAEDTLDSQGTVSECFQLWSCSLGTAKFSCSVLLSGSCCLSLGYGQARPTS